MKRFEIALRKLLLHLFLLFQRRRKKLKPSKINSKTKVLLIRLNRIGDALVTTPFIKALKEASTPHITVLADRRNSFIFENCPSVDSIIVFKKGLKDIFRLVKKLNSEKYDFVIDLHDDVSTTVSLLLSRLNSLNIIGLSKGKDALYSHTVPRIAPDNHHVIERNMEILRDLGISFETSKINIQYRVSEEYIKETQNFLDSNYSGHKFLVGINISAGSIARFWGVERFQNLINDLDMAKYNILLMCTPGDEHLARKINIHNLPIFFSSKFEEFAAMIGNLDLLFTPDTSVVHIASSFNTPLFGLYVKFNTSDVIWYPYQSTYDAVITEEPDFKNLDYRRVKEKFIPFIERIYNDGNT